jgi:tetratricopeptide (TPR) repeat protein
MSRENPVGGEKHAISCRYNEPMPLQSLVRSHLETGYHAQLAGDLNRAISAYRQAFALAPDDANVLHLLGTATLQIGNSEEAVALLQRAAQRQRDNPALLGNLAQAHFACGHYEQAREIFRKASRLNPQDPCLQVGTATALAMQGKLKDAETILQRLVQRFAQEPLVWLNLGNVLRDEGRPADAVEKYQRAIALAPDMIDARNNLGGVLHAVQRFAEAEAEFRACIASDPHHVLARCNLASLLIDVGRFAEAEAVCRELVQKNPGMSLAHTFLGAAIGHQGRLVESLACHRDAAQLSLHDATALRAYGAALCEAGLFHEGLRWFARCFSLQPDLISAHQVFGTVLLGMGRLADGWIEYGTRPARLRCLEKYPHLSLARTLAPDFTGKHICVMREQGLGDELFFLRYSKALHARGARITYRSSDKLRSILERISALDHVIGEDESLPAAEIFILAGDLPHAVSAFDASPLPTRNAGEDRHCPEFPYCIRVYWPRVPPPLPLEPLAERLAAVREALAQAGPPPYLGLTWRGGTAPETQTGATWVLYKEIGISGLASAVRDFPGTVLALQRKLASGEIEALAAALGRAVHDFSALNEDLESMLALLALIDEYIGVSNTNMHMRAGVGKTARVLVPSPAEWRWTYAASESPWFRGFRTYRQSLQGSWSTALDDLKRDLGLAYPNV